MPKGQTADGQPFKPPGRKNNDTTTKGPYRFRRDVVDILDNLPDGITATSYIQDAIREKHKRETSTGPNLPHGVPDWTNEL